MYLLVALIENRTATIVDLDHGAILIDDGETGRHSRFPSAFRNSVCERWRCGLLCTALYNRAEQPGLEYDCYDGPSLVCGGHVRVLGDEIVFNKHTPCFAVCSTSCCRSYIFTYIL